MVVVPGVDVVVVDDGDGTDAGTRPIGGQQFGLGQRTVDPVDREPRRSLERPHGLCGERTTRHHRSCRCNTPPWPGPPGATRTAAADSLGVVVEEVLGALVVVAGVELLEHPAANAARARSPVQVRIRFGRNRRPGRRRSESAFVCVVPSMRLFPPSAWISRCPPRLPPENTASCVPGAVFPSCEWHRGLGSGRLIGPVA